MTEFTKAQNDVFDEALAQLKEEPWFKGICCDDFPSDEECTKDFDGAVSRVACSTMYWDAPNMGFTV